MRWYCVGWGDIRLSVRSALGRNGHNARSMGWRWFGRWLNIWSATVIIPGAYIGEMRMRDPCVMHINLSNLRWIYCTRRNLYVEYLQLMENRLLDIILGWTFTCGAFLRTLQTMWNSDCSTWSTRWPSQLQWRTCTQWCIVIANVLMLRCSRKHWWSVRIDRIGHINMYVDWISLACVKNENIS